MEVRELAPDDIPRFAVFLRTLEPAEWTKGLAAPEIELAISERLGKYGACSTTLIATDSGGVISGFGSVHWMPNLVLPGIEGYVSELFVAAGSRGQGIGGSLLKEIEARAVAKGCHRLSLLNLKNRESYLRGFYRNRQWVERTNAANMIKVYDR